MRYSYAPEQRRELISAYIDGFEQKEIKLLSDIKYPADVMAAKRELIYAARKEAGYDKGNRSVMDIANVEQAWGRSW